MKYIYPKISNCLVYRKYDAETVEITDHLTEQVYYLCVEEAKFAVKLDGNTSPDEIETSLSIPQILELLDKLDASELLRYDNKWVIGDGTVLHTIWEPKMSYAMKLIAFLCNNLLLILWLPILIAGILMFKKYSGPMGGDWIWTGSLIGLLVGMVMHEFGHAFAGISYGAKLFEMGFLTMYKVIPGAYVILNEKKVKNRLKRVQINAAGVEMNLLLTGVFLMLSVIFNEWGYLFFSAAIQNAFLAAFNLTLINGLDGMTIASELLGIKDAAYKATEIIFSRDARRELAESDPEAGVTIAACCIICAFRIVWPIILLLNILEVVVCFL